METLQNFLILFQNVVSNIFLINVLLIRLFTTLFYYLFDAKQNKGIGLKVILNSDLKSEICFLKRSKFKVQINDELNFMNQRDDKVIFQYKFQYISSFI